jgi:hypothetical protein
MPLFDLTFKPYHTPNIFIVVVTRMPASAPLKKTLSNAWEQSTWHIGHRELRDMDSTPGGQDAITQA